MAGSSSGGDDDGMVQGINVTPLVDITLVLLIIMMVTAKLIAASQQMPLDLPKAANSNEQQVTFGVELHANGETIVNGKRLASDDAVLPLAKEELARTPDLRATIRADTTVQHGRVIHVLDVLKTAGITKVAFGTTPVPPPGATASPTATPAPATGK